MQAFTLYEFTTKNHQVELVLPETWQAETIFEQLKKNQKQFTKYLTWANKMDSPEKEVAAIKTFQEKMIAGTAFNLTILVDGQPAGMLDLHYLNKKSGEVGYWLSGDYQHLGIMTQSVELLVKYSFEQLHLQYLLLRTASDNLASQHVAARTDFKYLKIDENGHKVFILKNKK